MRGRKRKKNSHFCKNIADSISLSHPFGKETVKEAHRQLIGYVENQLHRMDYPLYRKNGWQIGSGPVEAACKGVIGQRLKGTGMRWGETGAQTLCHLRALLCSDDHAWNTFWATPA